MTPTMNWDGVLPAITTPFTPAGDVDHAFLAEHARWMLDAGCRGVVALGDQASGRLGRGLGGGGAQLLDRGALLGRDLVLGHSGAALDQRFRIGLRLGDDLVRLMLRALEQGLAILVGRCGLRLIFGLESLRFLAQAFRFGELPANLIDLLVERARHRPMKATLQKDQDHHHHRQCDPPRGAEAEGGGLRRFRDLNGCS